MSTFRLVTDSLGTREIPEEALYGAHTSRSMENFPISGRPLPMEIIAGMATLKIAAARANHRLNLLSQEKAQAIEAAARRVIAGAYPAEFPVDVFQAGSGTSSHMNLNEVLANLATATLGEKVHPNDDVNMGQSTNDIFPSGGKIAICLAAGDFRRSLELLEQELAGRAAAFAEILKCGRTHLQDAVPVTLGQEFAAYALAVHRAAETVDAATEGLRELAAGGNAVGTGINAPEAFRAELIAELNTLEQGTYYAAEDGLCATRYLTPFAAFTAALRNAALVIQQLCNDLRLMSSGPRAGLGEISLPPVEAGSSIMPGKINPSICEAVNMACIHVLGLDHAVAAAAGAGQLELNTHMPLVVTNALDATRILGNAARVLATKCIAGIRANEAVCRRQLEESAALATLLSPRLGYDAVAALVKEALETGQTLREIAAAKNLLDAQAYENLMASSTTPNRPAKPIP